MLRSCLVCSANGPPDKQKAAQLPPQVRHTETEALELSKLRKALAEQLAAPLQARISSKYFTGGAAAITTAAVAAAAKAAPAAAASGEGKGKGKGKGEAAPLSIVPADAMAQVMQQAGRLRRGAGGANGQGEKPPAGKDQGAKAGATASGKTGKDEGDRDIEDFDFEGAEDKPKQPAGAKQQPMQQKAGGKQQQQGAGKGAGKQAGGKKGKQGAGAAPAGNSKQQKLQRLLMSRNQLKKQRKGGMVVIPSAFGRDLQGANALETLRAMTGRK